MKKNYNSPDIHKGQEQAKKLYRTISDYVKRINDGKACAETILDLFTPNLRIQRSKLREYCERLIFSDPTLYARKAEELLWRKCYYEIVAAAKTLKQQDYSDAEKSSLQSHLNAGIGFYHHYITRLQAEFNLSLAGKLDFTLCAATNKHQEKSSQTSDLDVLLWAKQSVHKSLIYLGDLNRYKLEIYPNWDQNLAIKYYYQARFYQPENGMPHNQLGTLASSQNQNLEAVYHYLQCVLSKQRFEWTENNLHRLFEKNSQFLEQLPVDLKDGDCIIELEPAEQIKRFLARFLLLTDIWFFNKKVPHIYDLCHQTNIDLQECLTFSKRMTSENGDDESVSEPDSVTNPSYLRADVIFKLGAICLMCLAKLKEGSFTQQTSNVVAFTLAVYLQLIQTVLGHIQEAVLNFPLPAENGLKKKARRRRKKVPTVNDSDESEGSDHEMAPSDDSEESELSEHHEESDDLGSSSEDELIPLTNGHHDTTPNLPLSLPTNPDNPLLSNSNPAQSPPCNLLTDAIDKSRKINLNDMLDIVQDEPLLATIKLLSDWLISNEEVLKSCGTSSRTLLHQLINLVNLINVPWENDDLDVKDNTDKIVLPEEGMLRGVDLYQLEGSGGELVKYGESVKLTAKEEVVVRVKKLVEFARNLCKVKETGVSYEEELKMFVVEPNENEMLIESCAIIDKLEEHSIDENSLKAKQENNKRGQLLKMKHMGQLWLAAEVKDLENRVRGKASLSPYLVIDIESLTNYLSIVKHLVNSRKFIVIVPSTVVSALDDLKKDKQEARDAIRWLESQFQHGNRFFRAQRPQERRPLPYIKYPKKKDRDAFIYIQIIECCHYLAEQQKGATNLVTLLTGDGVKLTGTGSSKGISYKGLAQSASVNLEMITEFYGKWKKSSKGKR